MDIGKITSSSELRELIERHNVTRWAYTSRGWKIAPLGDILVPLTHNELGLPACSKGKAIDSALIAVLEQLLTKEGIPNSSQVALVFEDPRLRRLYASTPSTIAIEGDTLVTRLPHKSTLRYINEAAERIFYNAR